MFGPLEIAVMCLVGTLIAGVAFEGRRYEQPVQLRVERRTSRLIDGIEEEARDPWRN